MRQHVSLALLFLLALMARGQVPLASPAARESTVVDVDMATGHVHVSGPDRDVATAPGSTLKPLVLWTALRLGAIAAQTRVSCPGTLRVAGRNLACSHPASLRVLDAEEALAYSCNAYVAQVARQMSAAALRGGLHQFGLRAQVGAEPDRRVLVALGVQGVAVTPVQLAQAYAALARALQASDAHAEVVRRGLLGSVAYGMAHAAATPGVILGGKTGTVHGATPGSEHGWFAGLVFGNGRLVTHVVVVYAPAGSGADAASAAHHYLQGRAW